MDRPRYLRHIKPKSNNLNKPAASSHGKVVSHVNVEGAKLHFPVRKGKKPRYAEGGTFQSGMPFSAQNRSTCLKHRIAVM